MRIFLKFRFLHPNDDISVFLIAVDDILENSQPIQMNE